jgi:RNA polymerase sigma-70 factor, ECF subfamily
MTDPRPGGARRSGVCFTPGQTGVRGRRVSTSDSVSSPAGAAPADFASALLAHREAFKGFLTARLGNAAEAEDVLQNGLVKALHHAGELKEHEKLIPWFYRLLRHALVDHVRSRSAASRREEEWAALALVDDDQTNRHLCSCFERLLPALKPTQAELIRRVELGGETVAAAAAALGLTPNHASVLLHRARADLRSKLTLYCADCACLVACECD